MVAAKDVEQASGPVNSQCSVRLMWATVENMVVNTAEDLLPL